MDNQWKTETCETCDFVAGGWVKKTFCNLRHAKESEKCKKIDIGSCRKNPPSIPTRINVSRTEERYPVVYKHTHACSCWRENKEIIDENT